jgi:hypothetical protein
LTQDELTAKAVYLVFEGSEAVVKPPLARTTQGPNTWGHLIQDEDHDNGLTTIDRCNEGRIIGNAKIIAEPHK